MNVIQVANMFPGFGYGVCLFLLEITDCIWPDFIYNPLNLNYDPGLNVHTQTIKLPFRASTRVKNAVFHYSAQTWPESCSVFSQVRWAKQQHAGTFIIILWMSIVSCLQTPGNKFILTRKQRSRLPLVLWPSSNCHPHPKRSAAQARPCGLIVSLL